MAAPLDASLFSPLGVPKRFDAAIGEIGFVKRRPSSPDWQIRNLMNRNDPILAMAVEVGFDDVYYFSRLFRKMTGFSPWPYRNI